MQNTQPKLVMLTGLPGSGKTTYAENLAEQGFSVISSDAIRGELYGGKFSVKTNDVVFWTLQKRAAESLVSGKDTVIDATNLTPFIRMDNLYGIREALLMAGDWDFAFQTSCIVLETPLSLCLFRNKIRGTRCPEHTMHGMYRNFQYPDRREGFSEIKSICRDTDLEIIAGYSKDQKEDLLDILEDIKEDNKYGLSDRCNKEKALQDIDRAIKFLREENHEEK